MHRNEVIKSEGVKPSVPDTIEGTGMGKKTIDAICSEKGLSLDDILARVKQKGIKANPNDKLKDVANKLGNERGRVFF